MLIAGLRLSVLLKPEKNRPSNRSDFGFIALFIAFGGLVYAVAQAVAVTPPRVFNPNGLQPFATECVLLLCATWVMAKLIATAERALDMAALLFMAGSIVGLVGLALTALPGTPIALDGVQLSLYAWWFFILVRLACFFSSSSRLRVVLGVLLTFALTVLPWEYGMQAQALWQPDMESAMNAASDDADDLTDEPLSFDAEAVLYDQPRLINRAIDQLTPREVGKSNLYLIAFAGDGEENVFRNEVEFVEKQFQQRFDALGHTLVLENNPETVEQYPIASLTNLKTALDAIAEKMDPQEDVLFLYITSHGSKDHEIYVSLNPLPLNQMDPDALAQALQRTPIRWKVIVISACYSGAYINALRNSTTMVITAAREDRPSFGCGVDSNITYFGKAFFVQALNQNDSFRAAFSQAQTLISDWEDRDEQEHSFPQIASTALIEEKLKAWRAGIRLGAPVPFEFSDTPKN